MRLLSKVVPSGTAHAPAVMGVAEAHQSNDPCGCWATCAEKGGGTLPEVLHACCKPCFGRALRRLARAQVRSRGNTMLSAIALLPSQLHILCSTLAQAQTTLAAYFHPCRPSGPYAAWH